LSAILSLPYGSTDAEIADEKDNTDGLLRQVVLNGLGNWRVEAGEPGSPLKNLLSSVIIVILSSINTF